MSSVMLQKEIIRLLDEYNALSSQRYKLEGVLNEMDLLELKERLELEIAVLHYEKNSQPKEQKKKQKQFTQQKKKHESRFCRLFEKFRHDPHAFFADSSKVYMRMVSLVIPKKGE